MITLAILLPGEEVIGRPDYDPKTREVFVTVKRLDGTTTEERALLPTDGAVQVVQKTATPTGARGFVNYGKTDREAAWKAFKEWLKKQ